jgi:hypothetical protein
MQAVGAAARRRIPLLFAAAVVTVAIGSAAAWSWANHLDLLPSSIPLACEGVDLFRCHDGASRALAAVGSGSTTRKGSLPREVAGIRVEGMDRLAFCLDHPCPLAAVSHWEGVSHWERVTVRYRVLTGFMASDVVDVTTYRSGMQDVVLQGLVAVP